MWSHWIGTTIQFGPGIRFDHSWDDDSYDNGTKYNQLKIASDLIFYF